jgi:hypothetical protein
MMQQPKYVDNGIAGMNTLATGKVYGNSSNVATGNFKW